MQCTCIYVCTCTCIHAYKCVNLFYRIVEAHTINEYTYTNLYYVSYVYACIHWCVVWKVWVCVYIKNLLFNNSVYRCNTTLWILTLAVVHVTRVVMMCVYTSVVIHFMWNTHMYTYIIIICIVSQLWILCEYVVNNFWIVCE